MKFTQGATTIAAFFAICALSTPTPDFTLEVAVSIDQEKAEPALLTPAKVVLVFGTNGEKPEYRNVTVLADKGLNHINFNKHIDHITLFGAAACSIFNFAKPSDSESALHDPKTFITSFGFPVTVPVPHLKKEVVVCEPVKYPCAGSSADSSGTVSSCSFN